MMSVIHWLLAKFEKQFVVYCLIGVSGVVLDFALFCLMVKHLGCNYQMANAISATIAITNNYWWNRKYNFRAIDRPWTRYIRFFFVGAVGLGVMSALLFVFVEVYFVGEVLAKGLAVVLVIFIQYYFNKRYSFGLV